VYFGLPHVAREWNTPIREPWNGVIKTALDAVDQHNTFYFRSGDKKHLEAAQKLREYVTIVKNLIRDLENQG
jgi:hypothetical protein